MHQPAVRKAVILLFAPLLLSCGGSDPDREERLDSVRVGIIPIAEVAPLFVGIDKGLFAKYGIELELVRMAGGAEILPGVGTGSIDIGFSNVVSLVLFHENRNEDYTAFIGGTYETADDVNHALLSDQPVGTSGTEWTGLTVAVNTRNNIEELMLRRYFRNNGIDATQVNLRAVPFPAMEAALERGDVDVASMVEPFITLSQSHGKILVSNQYLETKRDTVLVATYVTQHSWLETNHELAQRFKQAFLEATRFINDPTNSRELRTIISSHTKMSADIAQRIGLPLMIACVRPENLQEIVNLAYREGWTEERVAVASLVSEQMPSCR